MDLRAFVQASEQYLLARGWVSRGHNGTWLMFSAPGLESMPLPTAVLTALRASVEFQPVVECYLTLNGWARVECVVCGGWPLYHHESSGRHFVPLGKALLEQLKLQRLELEAPADIVVWLENAPRAARG